MKWEGKFKFVALFWLALLACSGLVHADDNKREIGLSWQAAPNGDRYDVEVSPSEKMTPIVASSRLRTVELVVRLGPGTYFFHVRPVDKSGKTANWYAMQKFVVPDAGVDLKAPDDKHSYDKKLDGGGILFQWSGGKETPIVEVRGRDGRLLKTPARGASYLWIPPGPGTYWWRVGFQDRVRTDWSPFRVVKVEEGAFSDKSGVPAVKKSAPPEWWLIARVAQAADAYNGADYSKNFDSATGAGIIAVVSAELRWRARRDPTANWLLSGGLDFEAIRETVNTHDYYLPRIYGRVFYTGGTGQWRTGPFLQLGAGDHGIFIVSGDNVPIEGRVFRESVGPGYVAVYNTSPNTYLSALLCVRYDLGASTTLVPPGQISGGLGYEAGFGVSVGLTPTTIIEARLRWIAESDNWTTLNPAPAAPVGALSGQSNNYLILDAGIGFKF